jgi:peptidoglycan/xylan/chitin deacetylase (PgdA/CDA1 family)
MAISHFIKNVISIFLIACIFSFTLKLEAAGPNLINNLSFENGSTGWSQTKWGINKTNFTIENNGQDGNKSGKVEMTSYLIGDARWSFDPVNVSPNSIYEIGFFYKSNVSSYILMDITNNNNLHEYKWLGNVNASPSTWSSFYYKFSTASDTKNVNFYIPLNKVGYIQTDNYYIVKSDTQPPNPSIKFTRPLISIDFDDGWKSAYNNGFPILNEFGFKGTEGIVTNTVESTDSWDRANYMTKAEILNLKNQGHRIASHTKSHSSLIDLTPAQALDEIQGSKQYLESIIGEQVNYFITPYCSFNTAVTNIIKQYYNLGMRNCDTTFNAKSTFNRYNINSFPILVTTTDAEIKTALEKAKANNEWLVFMYHKVDSSNDQYSVSATKLRQQMQLIKNSGIAVKPSQDALLELIPQI